MRGTSESCANCSKSDNSDASNSGRFDSREVGKEDRKRRVLALLVESDLSLPPEVIFHNVKPRGADFERRSVDNYLNDLVQDGLVDKVDEKRGYYAATAAGKALIEDESNKFDT